jgi:hypothetical protein
MMKKMLVSGILATSLGLTAASSAFASSGSEQMNHRHPMPISGEVLSIGSDSLTMSVNAANEEHFKKFLEKVGISDGEKVTVNISSDTKMIENKQEVDLSDFSVGQTIFVAGKIDGSTIDAKFVADKLPKPVAMKGHGRMEGEVTAISTSGNSLTVKGRDGESHTVTYNDNTKFYVDGEVQSENDVSVGDMVKAKARFDKELKQIVATTITVVGAAN